MTSREDSLDHPNFHDFAISELSAKLRSRLQRLSDQNWFSSAGFAESYWTPPAQRVAFLEDRSGQVIEKCYYREDKWAGLFKEIAIFGPADPASRLLSDLQQIRRAHIVRLSWMTEPNAPLDKTLWKSFAIRRRTDDYCIRLPGSPSEYLQTLGSSTRKHMPYYVRRLDKEWNSNWGFQENTRSDISYESYERLFELNRLRMDQKGRRSAWTEELRRHRWRLVQESGLLCSLRFENEIVAGTLSFLHEREAYLIVLAHDPQFDRLNLGNISLWLTIQYLIRSRYNRYHLMWGRSSYKEQFGGKIHPLFDMLLFRGSSVAALWLAADSLMLVKGRALATKISEGIRRRLPARGNQLERSSVDGQPSEENR
jgi:CelD/BcsL family acetyltransferase involved in cellulose biosynthesis